MNFLLDTNVVSEWARPRPDPNVVRWLLEADEDSLYLSVLTFAEIRMGIESMQPGQRRESLDRWLDDELTERFEPRILNVDLAIARAWGGLVTRSQRIGANLGAMDALFAATAQVYGLTFVTRNMRHFDRLGIALLNPWLPPSI